MAIYINGIGSISTQDIHPDKGIFSWVPPEGNRMTCVEPDYKDLIPPMQLRRMSKVVRIGVAAAKAALKDAGLEKPDIITTGTAYGCLADTEIFLGKLLTQNEAMLTPTSFIQSTHNTVSGQIALMTACHGHNFTYVHRGHSYEHSLQEASMWLLEQPELQVLCGGVDEMTQHAYEIIGRFGTFKQSLEHASQSAEGTIAGEGANLFLLSSERKEQSYAEVVDCRLCTPDALAPQLEEFLQVNRMASEEIDLFLCGLNGDSRYDEPFLQELSAIPTGRLGVYKKWGGEYPTSGSFGLTLAAMMLRFQTLPSEVCYLPAEARAAPQTILLHNHYKNKYHSLILLRKA